MKSLTKEPADAPARYGGTIRIEDDIMELLRDEQYRLRKKEGKKHSYSEILRRMWAAYAAAGIAKTRGVSSKKETKESSRI